MNLIGDMDAYLGRRVPGIGAIGPSLRNAAVVPGSMPVAPWEARLSGEQSGAGSTSASLPSTLSVPSEVSLVGNAGGTSAGLDPLSPRAMTAAGAAALTQVMMAASSALFEIKAGTRTGLGNLIGSPGFGLLLQASAGGGGGAIPAAAGPMGVMQAQLLTELEQLAKLEQQFESGNTTRVEKGTGLPGTSGTTGNA